MLHLGHIWLWNFISWFLLIQGRAFSPPCFSSEIPFPPKYVKIVNWSYHIIINLNPTLRTVPVANPSEWTRTWSSYIAHSTKPARIVPGGFPSIQSLPIWRSLLDLFDELHKAGERVKLLDCQGEKGWAQNNSKNKQKSIHVYFCQWRLFPSRILKMPSKSRFDANEY